MKFCMYDYIYVQKTIFYSFFFVQFDLTSWNLNLNYI